MYIVTALFHKPRSWWKSYRVCGNVSCGLVEEFYRPQISPSLIWSL